MAESLCGTCRFFVPIDDGEGLVGRCRRHAPTPNHNIVSADPDENVIVDVRATWPCVIHDEWCGDYRSIGVP